MKKILFFHITYLLLLIVFMASCNKTAVSGDKPNPSARLTDLISVNWGLTSSTRIDSFSTGAIHRYAGAASDSLIFLWGFNSNVSVYGLLYSLGGYYNQPSIISIAPCSGISHADTTTIAYDTIICAQPFKPSYSDTLFVSKASENYFVFKVRYADANGKGVEIDSFYRRFYRGI